MGESRQPIAKARSLRASSTEAERKLWRVLRGRRLAALTWWRQVPLGRYIVDFVCFEHRLIVECDGSQRDESPRDEIRDAWLRQQGLTIVRFWNHEVLNAPESVTDTIPGRAGLPFCRRFRASRPLIRLVFDDAPSPARGEGGASSGEVGVLLSLREKVDRRSRAG